MSPCDYEVPLGVECAWPAMAACRLPRPSAWSELLAAVRRFFV